MLQYFYLDRTRFAALTFRNDTKRFFVRLRFEAFLNQNAGKLMSLGKKRILQRHNQEKTRNPFLSNVFCIVYNLNDKNRSLLLQHLAINSTSKCMRIKKTQVLSYGFTKDLLIALFLVIEMVVQVFRRQEIRIEFS